MAAKLEDFVCPVAHDLRSPLRKVVTIAEILREDFVGHCVGKLELIDILGKIADKTKILIGDVLARAHATALTTEWVRFDFWDLVAQIKQMLAPMGRVRWIAPVVSIVGDRATPQIVLRNLMDNALKHAHPDEDRQANPSALELVFDVAQAQSDSYCVTLDDNGAGFRETKTDLNRTAGGFGLMAVRRLLGRQGGQLTVCERPGGGGARLEFTLTGTCAAPCQSAGRVAS